MTDGQNWGQAPQYPPEGYGQQYPQDQPWRPQQYDPYAHQQRIAGGPPFPPQGQPWPQPGYGQPPQPQFRPAPQPPQPPQQAPRRRKPRRRLRIFAWGCVALLAVVVLIVVLGGDGKSPGRAPANPGAAASAKAAAKAKAKLTAKRISACYARKPASGDLYVRTTEPGLQAQAQEIGGERTWNYVANECQSSLDFTIASAGQAAGECTTVGYKADNPGYDADAVPAAPIPVLAGEAGPGCWRDDPNAEVL